MLVNMNIVIVDDSIENCLLQKKYLETDGYRKVSYVLSAKEVIVKLAYSIGVAEPVMATAIVDGKEMPIKGYDLTPEGIKKLLELNKPQFQKTAEWGHFGNGFKWDV